ncbi:MAG: hypothetical protein IJ786_02915 [Bacteroidaceae bacterium]|nr:hypothetical protein [Bacteroidaceae bacterium]
MRRTLLILQLLIGLTITTKAQTTDSVRPILSPDELELLQSQLDSMLDEPEQFIIRDTFYLSAHERRLLKLQSFNPDPKRALWLALVLPGAGQIYNRKYWKLPIIYGGFLGCTYALLWNQQMYKDYSQAYLDIMDDDPNTASYMDMLPPRYDITGKEERFKTIFKNRKDRYRRYRDLSAFAFVGVYIISVIDAYVDAQLSHFDISPDISLQVQPSVIDSHTSTRHSSSYGIGVGLHF